MRKAGGVAESCASAGEGSEVSWAGQAGRWTSGGSGPGLGADPTAGQLRAPWLWTSMSHPTYPSRKLLHPAEDGTSAGREPRGGLPGELALEDLVAG